MTIGYKLLSLAKCMKTRHIALNFEINRVNKVKEYSTRQLKVGQEIKFVLSEIFMKQDIYVPGTNKVLDVTVSEVRVAADLANATVFFFPLAGKDPEKTQELLNSIAGKIKFQMGKKLHLKKIPSLFFKLDTSFENAHKIDNLIKEVVTGEHIEVED